MRTSATLLVLAAGILLSAGCTVRPQTLGSGPAGGRGDEADRTALGHRGREDRTSGAVELRPWEYAGGDGLELVTPSFSLFTTLDSERRLRALPVFYEGCLDHYTSVFGPLPPPRERLVTYIFRYKRQWRHKTVELLPEQADAFMSLGRGGFTTRGISVLYDIGPNDTLAIAAHEGWHQYTQTSFKHALPVWLEEGIATYMEAIRLRYEGNGTLLRSHDNEERRQALRRAVLRDRLIPMEALLSRAPQSFLKRNKTSLLVYYGQVWALARFLAEGEGGKYRPALQELLADAAEGRVVGRMARSRALSVSPRRSAWAHSRNGPAVVLEYFNGDLDEFTEEYHRYVRYITGTHGHRRTMSGSASERPAD